MIELKVKNENGRHVIDSRDVAEMVDRNHAHLIRDIRQYIEFMTEDEDFNESRFGSVDGAGNTHKFAPSDFFIESSYVDSKGESRPCYLITKKGCDMIANKMTGKKGVLFTAAYVTAFDDMEKRLTVQQTVQRIHGASFGSLANLINVTRKVMIDIGNTPAEIALMTKGLYEVCGISVPSGLANRFVPEQLSFYDTALLTASTVVAAQ